MKSVTREIGFDPQNHERLCIRLREFVSSPGQSK